MTSTSFRSMARFFLAAALLLLALSVACSTAQGRDLSGSVANGTVFGFEGAFPDPTRSDLAEGTSMLGISANDACDEATL